MSAGCVEEAGDAKGKGKSKYANPLGRGVKRLKTSVQKRVAHPDESPTDDDRRDEDLGGPDAKFATPLQETPSKDSTELVIDSTKCLVEAGPVTLPPLFALSDDDEDDKTLHNHVLPSKLLLMKPCLGVIKVAKSLSLMTPI